MRLEHVLPEGQHGSAEKATAPTRPPHWPHAPVAHAAEIWSASVLLPSVVTAPPLCKLMRSNAVNPTAPSAIATTDFSLPELRSHAQRLVAPESRPLSLESSYPSIARRPALLAGCNSGPNPSAVRVVCETQQSYLILSVAHPSIELWSRVPSVAFPHITCELTRDER